MEVAVAVHARDDGFSCADDATDERVDNPPLNAGSASCSEGTEAPKAERAAERLAARPGAASTARIMTYRGANQKVRDIFQLLLNITAIGRTVKAINQLTETSYVCFFLFNTDLQVVALRKSG